MWIPANPRHHASLTPPSIQAAPQLPLRTPPVNDASANVLFSPPEGTAAWIMSLLDRAKVRIDLATYELTNHDLLAALIIAHGRGIDVVVIADHKESLARQSWVAQLAKSGVPTYTDNQHAIFHHKYALIDDQILTGSYNWTLAAEHENAENAVLMPNAPQILAAYERDFEYHLSHSLTV